MNESNANLLVGIMTGMTIGLVVFLTRQDFLQQQCDNKLIKENKPRNFVCKVMLKAVVIDKLTIK